MAQIQSLMRLKQLVRNYYKTNGSDTNKQHELKGRANGFAEAVLLTTKITKKQIDEIIEKEHMEFFGMTREKRFQTAGDSDGTRVEKNWDKYEEPAYTRRPLRCKKKTKSPVQITNTS